MTALTYVSIALGAGLGGMSRYWCASAAARLFGDTWPWGTLLVNVVGSALLGFFATLTAPEGRLFVPPQGRLLFTVGFCGGFTTFSTFSLETLNLARGGELARASANVAANVICCLAGVWLGYAFATLLNRR